MTGRFAPSPTGRLHVGNLRTALLAWLFARASASRFVLRIEDLDPERSRAEHEAGQLADLIAIGIDWDEPVLRQSTRRAAHDAAIERLIAAGFTYPCFCTRGEIQQAAVAPHGPQGVYPGTCRQLPAAEKAAREAAGRPAALRLRSDGAVVTVVDRLVGPVSHVVDDIVLRRNDGVPAYNLAVVLDDAEQGIDEVVRGADLLDSTPSQAHLAQLLGVAVPSYAHVPLVIGADGDRLAKRHRAVTLADLAAAGIGADELRARLATSVGLASPGERVSPAQLVERFDPDRLPSDAWVWPGA